VVVLQADNTVLYERLEKRGYPQAKVQENVQCEIMMVLLEEARDSYRCAFEYLKQVISKFAFEFLDFALQSYAGMLSARTQRKGAPASAGGAGAWQVWIVNRMRRGGGCR
jgi:hypothetical protein